MIDLQELVSFGSIVSIRKTMLMGGVTLPSSPINEEGGKISILNKDGLNGNDMKGKRNHKMMKRRPSMLVVPDYDRQQQFHELELFNEVEVKKKEMIHHSNYGDHNVVHEIEGRGFFLATRKGMRKQTMEDRYSVMLDVMGNPKQAFFAVIDGHGGEAAAEFVSDNLGNNIVKELQTVLTDDRFKKESDIIGSAIRRGYLQTDTQFLNKDVNGGACAASVLIKNGEVYVANAGDCRVVLSRNGVAHLLTIDHCLTREDERVRIQNSGGYVQCWNGVWRVNGSLAVSRAIGDGYLKQWVISEPETSSFSLASSEISQGDFLVLASDGLWDKVSVQEAVDAVRGSIRSGTKTLLDMSCSRGCRDDITVMIVHLQPYFC